MKEFSKKWISSKSPKKQRKYRSNAPLHIKQKFTSVHLSKELRTKYERRNLSIRKGDKVKISRGQFKKKSGKVTDVNIKTGKIYVEGIETIKKDGSKTLYPLDPSNLIITELVLEDKKRKEKLGKKENKKNG